MTKMTHKAADPDNPIWTKRDFERSLYVEGLSISEATAALRKARGRQRAPKKVAVSIRLEPQIVAHFKKDGAGWQKRIEEALLKVVGK